ncbi:MULTISPECIES: hypothetical protein [Brevibacillus]|jgi:hypothetical protein|uniref:Uncharacterized protein n=1 Tax=Brevibacillus parabrevis TaxID=54914 RepID=A0A4Y3PM08_BREPA|nr:MULTISPECIES: hypothetical protein [Brevibacillus]KZE52857.1 hypothetical protein AV540_09590 [Brevibacillus parabrevis]MBU8711874.1 hypothetical protein [Brevibacillus parabrevis]MDH6348935.1 hypothetical protein [Brevibacillus sp. 1238]MDR5000953.1 hypothetical protein [Brevibacillus parabrevis]MED1723945.1 hypothetical protein [Brevibacillus parabrevis]
MAKRIKVTIADFASLKEVLNNPEELALYETANGNTYDADIQHDGFAVIDVTEDDYIELAPGEYQLMIEEWTNAGQIGDLTLQTKSDPADDTALLYRSVDAAGNEVQAPQSLPKQVVELVAKTWFGKTAKKIEE